LSHRDCSKKPEEAVSPTASDSPFLILLVTVSALLTFLYFASRNLHSPGLYYDECIFVNAALGGINDDFIYLRLFNVPVMIMPYIGALKSFMYAPLFSLFGVTPESIRLPVILLSAGTVSISFLLARRLFGTQLALLFLVLMATDPAFIFNIRLDSGPVALMLFFKMAALYSFFALLDSKATRHAWFLVAALALGLYDKLNFIWFVIALGGAALCCFGSELKGLYHCMKRQLLPPLILFVIVFFMAAATSLNLLLGFHGTMPDRTLLEKGLFVINLYKGTMNGSAIYNFVSGGSLTTPSWVNYLLIPLPIALLAFTMARNRTSALLTCHQRRVSWFFLLSALLIFIQIVVTREVGGAHHLMMLYPFHHLLVISIFSSLLPLCGGVRRKLLFTCGAVAIVSITYSQLKTDDAYASVFAGKSTFSTRWDPHIYALADYLKNSPADVVVSTDWGIHVQLFCLADRQSRLSYLDAWPAFKELAKYPADRQQWFYENLFKNRRVLVTTHTQNAEVMTGTRANFAAFAGSHCKHVTLENVFRNNVGEGLYEVYLVDDMIPERQGSAP